MEVGLRVVRGPDWKWQNQDGGEGHIGTVIEVGRSANSNTPDKTVVVQWDSGFRTNYRVGYQGFFDLRVYDQAPVGVKHTNICCDGCRQQGILGFRWQCAQCTYFNLCQSCYMNDKHDLNHVFFRYDSSTSDQRVKVGKRAKSVKIEAKGIFPGAKVVRGPDWDWGNQDGGPNKQGKVLDIRGWDSESGRSVANVQWDAGSTNVYRVGHKGKVDLKYVHEANGGFYYRDHLPKLGEGVEASSAVPPSYSFKVGDRVRVDLDVDTLKTMQEGHGGWNPKMADCAGKVGVVHRITDRGDIRVQYEGSNRWTIHPGALTKVSHFEVGDIVRITDSALPSRDQHQQGRSSDWPDSFRLMFGKLGSVLQVYSDGDLKVKVGEVLARLNAKCCTLVPHGQQEMNNTFVASGDGCVPDHPVHTLHAGLDDLLQAQQSSVDDPEKLVRAAAQGHLDVCRDIIRKHPSKLDQKSSGKTAIQVAAHQGHIDIVRQLLSAGVNLQLKDEDGDTALHYSAFGDQPEVMQLLLQAGADVNALNTSRCSALHIAVNKQHIRCVRVLLQHSCDVNVQDSYGDTGLHDAVSKDNTELIDLLLSSQNIDLTLRNVRGFNALHHSALKGNTYAAHKILMKARQLVDVQKDDGFAALHLAALNGHYSTADALISTGQANIEIENNRKQTPLMLAISQGHGSLTELLVSKGANVNAADEEGDTCLHVGLGRQAVTVCLDNSPNIHKIFTELKADFPSPGNLAVACYLVRNGADLDVQNRHSISPAMLITDLCMLDIVNQYSSYWSSSVSASSSLCNGNGLLSSKECAWCSDAGADVVFRPCGHRIACIPCSVRTKKCIVCHTVITAKIGPGGKEISKHLLESMEAAQMQELRYKMEQLEESRICSICLENAWNVAFLCGHSACSKCAEALKQCHMCRKTIQSKINLFT